jgi:DNA-binding NarL/FixJ family response regulator
MASNCERATVLAVDHNPILLGGIVTLIATEPGLQLIGTADGAEAAIEAFSNQPPQVVLMDLDLPDQSAFRAIRAMRSARREITIIGMATYEFDQAAPDALTSGASTVIFKDRIGEELLSAIFQALRNSRGH